MLSSSIVLMLLAAPAFCFQLSLPHQVELRSVSRGVCLSKVTQPLTTATTATTAAPLFASRPFSRSARASSPVYAGKKSSKTKFLLAFLTSVPVSLLSLLTMLTMLPKKALASSGGFSSGFTKNAPRLNKEQQLAMLGTFVALFVLMSLLHAAEIAITTLYPWKVREFAEEEGEGSPFSVLNKDITRVLTTILVASTTASIYATTLFATLVGRSFGAKGERYGAIILTCLTLFFVELVPKSIGINNAEFVARRMVAPITLLGKIVGPFGLALSYLAKSTLKLFGLQTKDLELVSEEELRLIVAGARESGSIEKREGEMIEGVLTLQDQKVKEIMQPRVEIVAVPKAMSVADVLGVIRQSGFSRIPVYDGEIDNIVGIVLAKDLIDFFVSGLSVESQKIEKKRGQKEREREKTAEEAKLEGNGAESSLDSYSSSGNSSSGNSSSDGSSSKNKNSNGIGIGSGSGSSTNNNNNNNGNNGNGILNFGFPGNGGGNAESVIKALSGAELASRMGKSIDDANLIESTYFVPQTMIAWNVLQEMRKRRVHLAIVVDEYGGTEGLVSLEDIIEEIVGDIFDEDDEEVFEMSEEAIYLKDDGTYEIRGDTDLDDVASALDLSIDEEVFKEIGTLSGFLISLVGEIPKSGDIILYDNFSWEVTVSNDMKVIEEVKVEPLVGTTVDGDGDKENGDDDEQDDEEYPKGGDIVDQDLVDEAKIIDGIANNYKDKMRFVEEEKERIQE